MDILEKITNGPLKLCKRKTVMKRQKKQNLNLKSEKGCVTT